MRKLTIFTPTYNRKHTLGRTLQSLLNQTSLDFNWLIIDDGSSDGTRQWVESLGEKVVSKGSCYDWMGRQIEGMTSDHFILNVPFLSHPEATLQVEYIYKPNGGLYTGYNVAYSCAQTELCVCIDSDDFMPNEAVEMILSKWESCSIGERNALAGLVGLDYNVVDYQPIGGAFCKATGSKVFALDLHHVGDVKYVFRTALMKQVAPQIGFEGEKDFNPHYMQMQVLDKYPILVVNENFCWVEYQTGGDSMSQAIYKQYVRSARSYAKYRIMEMQLNRGNSLMNKYRLCIHYVSSCIFSKDGRWLKNVPLKVLTFLAVPFGCMVNVFIRFKSR